MTANVVPSVSTEHPMPKVASAMRAIEQLLERIDMMKQEPGFATGLVWIPNEGELKQIVEEVVALIFDVDTTLGSKFSATIGRQLEVANTPTKPRLESDPAIASYHTLTDLRAIERFLSNLAVAMNQRAMVGAEEIDGSPIGHSATAIPNGNPVPSSITSKAFTDYVLQNLEALRDQLTKTGHGTTTVGMNSKNPETGVISRMTQTTPTILETTTKSTSFMPEDGVTQTVTVVPRSQEAEGLPRLYAQLSPAPYDVAKGLHLVEVPKAPSRSRYLVGNLPDQETKALALGFSGDDPNTKTSGRSATETAVFLGPREGHSMVTGQSDLQLRMPDIETLRNAMDGSQPTSSSTQVSTGNSSAHGTSQTASLARPLGFSFALAEQLRNVQLVEGTTRVQLSPRGLGLIEIEMITEADNSTSVVIRADNPTVLTSLRDIRDPLAQMLNLSNGGALSFEDKSNREDRNPQSDRSTQSASEIALGEEDMTKAAPPNIGRISEYSLDIMT